MMPTRDAGFCIERSCKEKSRVGFAAGRQRQQIHQNKVKAQAAAVPLPQPQSGPGRFKIRLFPDPWKSASMVSVTPNTRENVKPIPMSKRRRPIPSRFSVIRLSSFFAFVSLSTKMHSAHFAGAHHDLQPAADAAARCLPEPLLPRQRPALLLFCQSARSRHAALLFA